MWFLLFCKVMFVWIRTRDVIYYCQIYSNIQTKNRENYFFHKHCKWPLGWQTLMYEENSNVCIKKNCCTFVDKQILASFIVLDLDVIFRYFLDKHFKMGIEKRMYNTCKKKVLHLMVQIQNKENEQIFNDIVLLQIPVT